MKRKTFLKALLSFSILPLFGVKKKIPTVKTYDDLPAPALHKDEVFEVSDTIKIDVDQVGSYQLPYVMNATYFCPVCDNRINIEIKKGDDLILKSCGCDEFPEGSLGHRKQRLKRAIDAFPLKYDLDMLKEASENLLKFKK